MVRQLNRRSTVLFEHIDDFLKHKRKKTSNKLHEEASSLGVRQFFKKENFYFFIECTQ